MRGPERLPNRSVLPATIAVGLAFSLIWLVPGHTYDFIFDWLIARAVLSGESPHQTVVSLVERFGLISNELDFIPPRLPGAMLLISPIGLVPYHWTYVAGRFLTVASAVLLAWVLSRFTGGLRWYLLALPVILLMWPFSHVLATSQTGMLIAALIGLAYLEDNWKGGVSLGIAILLKLWPWLLIPALLIDGRRRLATWAAGTFTAFNLIGLAMPHITVMGTLNAFKEIATSEFLVRSLSPLSSLGMPLWVGVVIGCASLIVVRLRPRSIDWMPAVALGIAPLVWPHYLPALVIPPAARIARIAREQARGTEAAANGRA